MTYTPRVDGGDKLTTHLKEFRSKFGSIKSTGVGVFAGVNYPPPKNDDSDKAEEVSSRETADVVDVAAWHEFGTRNIPPRPFLSGNFNTNIDKYRRIAEYGAGKIVDDGWELDRVLQLVAVEVVKDTQAYITELNDPPLAPTTIKQRAKNTANPLVDTGLLRRSITWKLLNPSEEE